MEESTADGRPVLGTLDEGVPPKTCKSEKWHEKVDPVKVGELVYLVDENQPRNCWIRGYISAVFPGADGQVRVAEVTTRDFVTRKKTTYRRPVTKLCPLGLRMEIPGPPDPKFGAGNVDDGGSGHNTPDKIP